MRAKEDLCHVLFSVLLHRRLLRVMAQTQKENAFWQGGAQKQQTNHAISSGFRDVVSLLNMVPKLYVLKPCGWIVSQTAKPHLGSLWGP